MNKIIFIELKRIKKLNILGQDVTLGWMEIPCSIAKGELESCTLFFSLESDLKFSKM